MKPVNASIEARTSRIGFRVEGVPPRPMMCTGLALAGVMLAAPVLAHHPLGGAPMTTFSGGMLSGIGHPLLGFDHLFFVLLLGIVARYTGRALLAPLAYIVAMLAGCLLVTRGLEVPAIEPLVAFSLLALGAIGLTGRALPLPAALGLFAVAGVFHGAAFAGALVGGGAGAEAGAMSAVLPGYLLGLGVTQYLIAIAAGALMVRAFAATTAAAMQPRLASAVVAGAGLLLTLEHLEGAVLGAVLR